MKPDKATLNVNGRSYPVLVESKWLLGGTQYVRLDWGRMEMEWGWVSPTLYSYYFLKDIGVGRSDNALTYSENTEKTYPVNADWLTYEAEEKTKVMREPKHDHWKLTGVACRKMDEFSSEGYSIVLVEHSQDMNEGTITLHYKKEEV